MQAGRKLGLSNKQLEANCAAVQELQSGKVMLVVPADWTPGDPVQMSTGLPEPMFKLVTLSDLSQFPNISPGQTYMVEEDHVRTEEKDRLRPGYRERDKTWDVAPEAICPCADRLQTGKTKTYARCCLRKGVKFRENHEKTFEVRTADKDFSKVMKLHLQHMEARAATEGRTLSGSDKVFNFPSHFPAVSPAKQMKQQQNRMYDMLLAEGLFDPAFAFAAKSPACDFIGGKKWGIPGAELPKPECLARMKQWNDAVDEYIRCTRIDGTDTRSVYEIEREAKIDRYGCSYYRRCSGPGCTKVEQSKGEFRGCSKCRIVFYCSHACQRSHWKVGGVDSHRKRCGRGDGPKFLPSQQALNNFMKAQQQCISEMLPKMMSY